MKFRVRALAVGRFNIDGIICEKDFVEHDLFAIGAAGLATLKMHRGINIEIHPDDAEAVDNFEVGEVDHVQVEIDQLVAECKAISEEAEALHDQYLLKQKRIELLQHMQRDAAENAPPKPPKFDDSEVEIDSILPGLGPVADAPAEPAPAEPAPAEPAKGGKKDKGR